MHTKKTNNTNKLMQISYHYALKKIQKLQNLIKKKKKNFFFFVPASTPGTGRYFFQYETGGLYVPVCLLVQYIPAGTVRNRLPWIHDRSLEEN